MSKLTQADRAEIIRRSRAGETQSVLAEEYGVSQSTINRTINPPRKKAREIIDDPNPAITTETLQKRYWGKYKRLTDVIERRYRLLRTNRSAIEKEIEKWSRLAKEASTQKLTEAYQHRSDSYRVELAALDDLSDIDTGICDLLSDLKLLADVLVKARGAGLGNE